MPSIGCAESLLYGKYEEPAPEACEVTSVFEEKEGKRGIGCCLRTQTDMAAVFVSVGHKLALETAANRVLELSPKYRLPEPIRKARELLEE